MTDFMRPMLAILGLTAMAVAVPTATANVTEQQTSCTRHVAPSGSDDSPGSATRPWRTLEQSFDRLQPGDELCVRGGTYAAPTLTLPGGTAERRITVRPEGESTPVVKGRSSLVDPDFWTIRGLKWTNRGSEDSIVSVLAGTGWIFEGNEVTDGDYAGLLVGKSRTHGSPHDYVVRHNVFHDTGASNMYHNPGRHSRGGLIERNLFYNSGSQNLKLGWGGHDVCGGEHYQNFGIGEVTVRYNTMHGATQPLAVAEPGGELPVRIYRNLVTGSRSGYAIRVDNVEGCLQDNVRISHNLGDGGRVVEDFGDAPRIMAQLEGNEASGRVFDRDEAGDFVPSDPAAQHYGRFAPSDAD